MIKFELKRNDKASKSNLQTHNHHQNHQIIMDILFD
jgi:hypothetical protein